MERNRQKLVGQDKGSLTEQQTKGTGTTTIQIRRKHHTNPRTQRAALPDHCCHMLLSCTWVPAPSSPQPEPSLMAHDMEYPALFGQVGSARLAVPLPGFRWKLTLSWPNPGHRYKTDKCSQLEVMLYITSINEKAHSCHKVMNSKFEQRKGIYYSPALVLPFVSGHCG